MKIAVIGKYPPKTYEIILEKLSKDFDIEIVDTQEKLDELKYADIAILRILKLRKKDLEHIGGLKLIEKWGTGYDSIDIEYATKNNIKVCNVPGANAHIVAEITILHILAALRNLIRHNNAIRIGKWTKTEFIESTFSLLNKKVGLIGGGHIARNVAVRLQGFGCQVNYYDIARLPKELEYKYSMNYLSYDKLIETSDVVSIHVPLLDSTKGMISYDDLVKMKKTAIVINASRGGIVEEKNLIRALKENEIMAAGLDAFEDEPISNDNELLKMDNVILTPHIGGTSYDLVEIMLDRIIDNIRFFKDNKNIKDCVNF